jgi:glutaminase
MQILLEQSIHFSRPYLKKGHVADYIPALSMVDPSHLGVCVFTVDGQTYCAGNSETMFSIQSISKLFSLAYVLNHAEPEIFFRKIGMEPSGNPFYSLVQLEYESGKPRNPFINAGAIAVTGMIEGKNGEDKYDRLLEFIRYLVNDQTIDMKQEIYQSESETGYRNHAVANFMKHFGMIEGEVKSAVDAYFRQCSLEMNCVKLARAGLFLANHGVDPITKKQMIRRTEVGTINALLTMCGLYDASGEFAVKVGIPAKSGVGGGILGIVPNRMSIAVYGPVLNDKGNSVGGLKILEFLANELRFSLFE